MKNLHRDQAQHSDEEGCEPSSQPTLFATEQPINSYLYSRVLSLGFTASIKSSCRIFNACMSDIYF